MLRTDEGRVSKSKVEGQLRIRSSSTLDFQTLMTPRQQAGLAWRQQAAALLAQRQFTPPATLAALERNHCCRSDAGLQTWLAPGWRRDPAHSGVVVGIAAGKLRERTSQSAIRRLARRNNSQIGASSSLLAGGTLLHMKLTRVVRKCKAFPRSIYFLPTPREVQMGVV